MLAQVAQQETLVAQVILAIQEIQVTME
jgi:hypothetical protein